MTTYVLVGGAWIGGWTWKHVAKELRAADHCVYTPTLTGLGEREHLATPEVDLDTHIQDVVNVLEYEDLKDVMLVGHSYSGYVVTGVADRVPDRIDSIIYVAASVPRDGFALKDEFGGEEGWRQVRELIDQHGEGWRVPVFPFARDMAGNISEQAWDWFMARTVPQPARTFEQPIRFVSGAFEELPRVFIRCTADLSSEEEVPPAARTDPDWRYHELPTGHWPMLSMPAELTGLLLGPE